MPTNIRKPSNRLDELQLRSTNILSYKEIEDDDYRREYEFNTSTNRYTLILTQYPYDESSVDNNPWGYPEYKEIALAAVKKSEDALEYVPPVLQDKIKAAALKWW